MHEETIAGVTLKHVVDNLFNHNDLPNLDGTTQKSLHHKFFDDMLNINRKYDNNTEWPKVWQDWQHHHKLADLPFKIDTSIDLRSINPNPTMVSLAHTDNLFCCSVYLASTENAVIFIKVKGRNFTFCDNLSPETVVILSQSGKSISGL